MKKLRKMMVMLFVALSFQAWSQDAVGSWKGTLTVQGTEMPLLFHVTQTDGVYTSTMDSPTQSATDIPMDETTFANKELTIQFKQAGIKYVGQLEGTKISGIFFQGGMEFPLLLEKSEKTIPGNPALVTSDEKLEELAALDIGDFRYTVEDYFSKPKAATFRFSPDGKYLSYREKDENAKNHVYVKEIATGKAIRAIEEKEELVRGYGWINNEKLVYLMDKAAMKTIMFILPV